MPAASSDCQMSSPPERKTEAATAAIPPIIHTVPIDHLLMLINTSREATDIEQWDQPTRAPEHRKRTFSGPRDGHRASLRIRARFILSSLRSSPFGVWRIFVS